MSALAPTLHEDGELIIEMSGRVDEFAAVSVETLMLGGTRSPKYMRAAMDRLECILPRTSRREFAGLDHSASWNSDMRGHPAPVAEALRGWFAGPPVRA
jgi:hypothetical protein